MKSLYSFTLPKSGPMVLAILNVLQLTLVSGFQHAAALSKGDHVLSTLPSVSGIKLIADRLSGEVPALVVGTHVQRKCVTVAAVVSFAGCTADRTEPSYRKVVEPPW